MNPKERADKIKGIMAKKKITIEELSRQTKLHRNTIRNALDGKHSIDTATIQKIAAKLGVADKDLI